MAIKYPFTPELLDAIPEELAELFRGLELTLLQEICKRLKIAENLNEVTVQDIRALRAHGIKLEEIEKAIRETTRISQDKLDKLFGDVVARNQTFYTELIDISKVTAPEILATEKTIDAIKRQTVNEFRNITRSMGFLVDNGKTMLAPAKAYQWALDSAEMQVQSGAISYTQAIKNATTQLANSGLKTVEYESGHVDHVDVAVRRAVLTGVNQLSQEYREQSVEYLETDLVEVTAHIGARDTGEGPENHKSWQGKVYRWSKYPRASEGEYDDFEDVTGYGTGEGLGGWNCRHSFYAFIEGVSKRTYTDEELANIDPPPFEYQGKTYTAYEATQKQREIERTIRKWKRRKEAAVEPEDGAAYGARIRRLNKEYKDFSKAAGLPEQRERTEVLRGGKTTETIANSYNRDIIDSDIHAPIERGSKGDPQAISHFDVQLNKRQAALLESIPSYGSSVTVAKKSVSMKDLAALTAKTGNEFALFTKRGERLVIRGDATSTPIGPDDAKLMSSTGYRWSGHTHPGNGDNVKIASDGDYDVLAAFGQKRSVIYDSLGRYSVFWR